MSEPEQVLIWSGEHCAYWGADSKGYCQEVLGAGVYTHEVAKQITRHCGPGKCIRIITIIEWPKTSAGTVLAYMLVAAREEGRQEERERCAKIAESFTCGCCGMDGKAAAAIRATPPTPAR